MSTVAPHRGMARCRYCKSPIIWARHYQSGRPMSFDPDPAAGGLWFFEPGDRQGDVVAHYDKHRPEGYVSHHATCPHTSPRRRT